MTRAALLCAVFSAYALTRRAPHYRPIARGLSVLLAIVCARLLCAGPRLGVGPVTARWAVDVIFQSSQKMVKEIEDFLNITRIELGTMKYEQSEVNFKELVETVSKELRVNVEKKGLQFSLEIDSTAGYKLVGDSGKLAQAVGNLIDNAIKYTPARQEGGKQGWIRMTLSRVDGKIRLEVSDSGVGMPAEVIPKLFQKFTRAEDASQVNITGTGLGLYVAKQIVNAHHGQIWAESDGVGKGSRFIVEV